MSEVIVRMEMPKDCLWLEDGEIHKCPLLDDNDCCKGQSNEANEASESWSDLRKGCPIIGVLPEQHGDLIDRDVALDDVDRFVCKGCRQRKKDDCLWRTAYAAKGVLTEVDTIIAERSET